MRKQKTRLASKTPYLSPESSPEPPVVSAAAMDPTMDSASRPPSVAVPAANSRPTLQDILSNSAPPPWTLGAFMAYLSQNHCLETLEFTMAAERYQTTYAQVQLDENAQDPAVWSHDAQDYTFAIWRKLIDNYIMPCGPREVNLPSPVRDYLLTLEHNSVPPHPSELDEAVAIIYELMNDSVLLSFIDSIHSAMQQHEYAMASDASDLHHQDQSYYHYPQQQPTLPCDTRQGRPRRRSPKGSSSASSAAGSESSRSPKPSFLPQLNLGRRGRSPSATSSSADTAPSDYVGLVDDSGISTPPAAGEPLTPPTTPPTSDWNFSTSPNGIQRAIIHSAGWKRMSAKLGLGSLNRASRSSRRSHNTSGVSSPGEASSSGTSSSDGDLAMDSVDYRLSHDVHAHGHGHSRGHHRGHNHDY